MSDHEIVVVSGETDYFFSRTALMYVYMGHMKFEHTQPYENWFWEKNRIELKKEWIRSIDYSNKELICESGQKISYDDLIIAVGSKPNKFGWPGQDLDGVQGMYSYQDLLKLEENTQPYGSSKINANRGVIVGGGLIGIELAEMLLSRNINVTFLVREQKFWNGVLPDCDAEMIGNHIREHHVDLKLGTELKEIIPNPNNRVSKVLTNHDEVIDCELVGLTAGVRPNIGFLESSELNTDRGILVNRHLETNFDNVYAIGDCAQQIEPIGNRRPVEAVWYTGRMMGETVAQTICGNRSEYRPGNWFNSAKFFDIEYQTYGWVFNKPREGESHFHWQDDEGKRGITINYQTETRKFIGINTLGIRMRHNVFDHWLNAERSVEFVIENLKTANYDPEFYHNMEALIIAKFNNENGSQLRLKPIDKQLIFG